MQQKIYYIHGYMSDPNSTKGTLFKEKLNAKSIKYRDCKPEDLVIANCLNRIKEEIKDDENAILIGSSLGGFLAAETALINQNVKQIILLNPAIIPPDFDIKLIEDMPQSILNDMKDIRLFEEKIDSDISILAGTLDDVVPSKWVIEFAKAQGADVKFLVDDHRFSQNIDKLPDVISTFIDKNIKKWSVLP